MRVDRHGVGTLARTDRLPDLRDKDGGRAGPGRVEVQPERFGFRNLSESVDVVDRPPPSCPQTPRRGTAHGPPPGRLAPACAGPQGRAARSRRRRLAPCARPPSPVASHRLGFLFSFFGLIDLIAILPFYLAVGVDLRTIRAFRLLRVIRILKLARYSAAVRRIHRAAVIAREEVLLFLGVALLGIYVSAVAIYYFEHAVQPEVFASIFHSLWWAVITLTTVGYGDMFSVTIGGRLQGRGAAGKRSLTGMLAGNWLLFALKDAIFSSVSWSKKNARQVSVLSRLAAGTRAIREPAYSV